MTGRRVRFALFVVSGLALLADVVLSFTADWTCLRDGSPVGFMDCSGDGSIVGRGLGGRIGVDGLVAIGLLALAGLVGTWLAELQVRRRTRRRLARGEPRRRRP